MASVSVCMIVRNEEEILSQAITSTVGLADEVVVLDTGSEDSTVELAESLGAKVLTGGDRMHKGKSRNQAIDAASGDWIVILDADERIADPVGLKEFLNKTDAQAVYIKLSFMDANDQPTLSYAQMRVWRRGTYLYKYRCHEVPMPTEGWGKLARTDFVWEHRPPAGRAWKLNYSLERLLLDVEENPDAARPLYYLGRQYMYRKEWELALENLTKYLGTPGRDAADAWNCVSQCHAGLGQEKERIVALFRACASQPGRRDWWGQLAQLYHDKGQDNVAVGLLKCALEQPMPAKTYVKHVWYGPHIYDLLARCLWKLKRYEEGYQYAIRAIELSPDNERLRKNLNYFIDAVGSKVDNPSRVPKQHNGKKVLFLARRDCANVGYRMMQAVNLIDGWCAHAVTCSAEYFCYPKDIFMPNQEEIDALCDWADIIHIIDDWPREHVTRYGKPIFATYNGSYYRANWELLRLTDAIAGIKQLCTTINLTQYGASWVPVPMQLGKIEPVKRTNGNFLVSHAPTIRSKKGTVYVEGLRGLDGIEVDIIEEVSNNECLRRKAAADLYIEQFRKGYGVNALEAWALGMPVVSNATDDIIDMIEEQVGYLPFVRSKPEELADVVCHLRDDKDAYSEARQRGMDYVKDFHDPQRVGRKLVELYSA